MCGFNRSTAPGLGGSEFEGAYDEVGRRNPPAVLIIRCLRDAVATVEAGAKDVDLGRSKPSLKPVDLVGERVEEGRELTGEALSLLGPAPDNAGEDITSPVELPEEASKRFHP